MSRLKQKVVKGVFWVLMEKFSTQVVTFGIGIVLARLLSPADYGTVALLTIFTAIAQVLADSGFGNALIQKKDTTELDFNSVFYLSLGLTTVLYCILFAIAPWVARFYAISELCPILRVVSITLFFNSINSIQNAELNRKFLFHLSFRISILSTTASAATGLVLALLGYGVWSLVWMGIAGGVVGVIARWVFIAWRPRLVFDFSALKPLFKYGWKVTASALLDTGFNNLYGLIIGKFYSRTDLSFVNKGRHLPELLMNNINGSLGQVAFPVIAKVQDNRIMVRETMRRMMMVSTFFVFPLMTLLAITAKNIILFLYGEKWLPATPYAMIACFTFALWPFHTINLQGIQAIGRSDIFLKLEIVKKVIALIILCSFLSYSVLAWCLAVAFVSSPLSVIINSWPNKKLLGYTLKMQIFDVLPTAIVCGIVALPLLWMNRLPVNVQIARFCLLSAQGIVAMVLFLLIAFIFRLRSLREIGFIIKRRALAKMPTLAPIFNYLDK